MVVEISEFLTLALGGQPHILANTHLGEEPLILIQYIGGETSDLVCRL
jgi:hypothetical protein